MIESIFLNEFRIAATFVQSFKDLQEKFYCLKKVHPGQFSKIHFVIHFHPSRDQPFSLPNGSISFLE